MSKRKKIIRSGQTVYLFGIGLFIAVVLITKIWIFCIISILFLLAFVSDYK